MRIRTLKSGFECPSQSLSSLSCFLLSSFTFPPQIAPSDALPSLIRKPTTSTRPLSPHPSSTILPSRFITVLSSSCRLHLMAPLRSRQSAHSARVTLYEPTATAANGTSDVLPTAAASPARRTRSRAAAELDSDIKDEQEEDRKPVKLEAKQEKAKSPRKPKKHVEALAVPHPAPKNWEETYAVIKKQRATYVSFISRFLLADDDESPLMRMAFSQNRRSGGQHGL